MEIEVSLREPSNVIELDWECMRRFGCSTGIMSRMAAKSCTRSKIMLPPPPLLGQFALGWQEGVNKVIAEELKARDAIPR
jgi:hypothetical protein